MSTTHACLVPVTTDSLEWIVSNGVCAGNRTYILCKSNNCSQLLSHLSGPTLLYRVVTNDNIQEQQKEGMHGDKQRDRHGLRVTYSENSTQLTMALTSQGIFRSL